jgi:hypothetical protein
LELKGFCQNFLTQTFYTNTSHTTQHNPNRTRINHNKHALNRPQNNCRNSPSATCSTRASEFPRLFRTFPDKTRQKTPHEKTVSQPEWQTGFKTQTHRNYRRL